MNFALRTFSVVLTISSTISCGVIEAEEVSMEDFEEDALQIIHGGTFQYSEKGVIRNVLKAGRLERWKDDDLINEVWQCSEGFTLYIEGNNINHEAILSGGRGLYDADMGHLIAHDNVILINNEGEKLQTEYLVWSNDSDRVYTNRPVRIETLTGTLEGKGLESDSKFENYRILNPTGAFEL